MNQISALIRDIRGSFLAVQWFRLCASTAGGMGLVPDRGIKIPHATQPKNK